MHTPKGFSFAAVNAGFRGENRNDLGLVFSETPAVTAATFTQNLYPAAPVVVGRERIKSHTTARAVVVNSGRANACTGEQGIRNCREALEMTAQAFGLQPHEVLPASTGVIGPQLRLQLWEKAMQPLTDSLGVPDAEGFTRAIMTTDAFPKMAEATVKLEGGEVRLLGVAKGAGMICPNMATMICIVMCDAGVTPDMWRPMCAEAVGLTFNSVTVDGDTSTNDTVYALANGASGVTATAADWPKLKDALVEVLGKLAYMLVQDGEGSSKVAHISVKGAASEADAEKIARTVGHSQLVKTALYGRDANWGRIVAAVGRAGVPLDPDRVRVSLCGVELFRDGQPVDSDFDALLAEPLKKRDLPIDIEVGDGPGSYTLLAADLGHEYVDCNASYRS